MEKTQLGSKNESERVLPVATVDGEARRKNTPSPVSAVAEVQHRSCIVPSLEDTKLGRGSGIKLASTPPWRIQNCQRLGTTAPKALVKDLSKSCNNLQ